MRAYADAPQTVLAALRGALPARHQRRPPALAAAADGIFRLAAAAGFRIRSRLLLLGSPGPPAAAPVAAVRAAAAAACKTKKATLINGLVNYDLYRESSTYGRNRAQNLC